MIRTAAQQFLDEVATFADAPAGEALIDSDPAMVVHMLIKRARRLKRIQSRGAGNNPDGTSPLDVCSPTSNQPTYHPDQKTR